MVEYTVQKLARLAGVSARTLRYYDNIGLLKPGRVNSSGYRIYGGEQVDRLQQILFYKELGVELNEISAILSDPHFDDGQALRQHHQRLLERRNRLDELIANVEMTINQKENGTEMTDEQKFQGFKQKLIDENEQKYGEEIREKYGDKAIDESNARVMNMSKQQYDEMQLLGQKVLDTLAEAFKTGDPAGELGQQAAELHKQWLCYSWKQYDKHAHANLAQMYVDDERFTQYYDKHQPGLAKFLRDAVRVYTGVDA